MQIKVLFLLILLVAVIIGYNLYQTWKASSIVPTIVIPDELEPLIGKNLKMKEFIVSSPILENGEPIPEKYTCDSVDVSLPLKIEQLPNNTISLAIIMYDPDAPGSTFYHWFLYDIKVQEGTVSIFIPEGIPKQTITKYGFQGVNDFNKIGYNGPCPPKGSKHRYIFLVLALDTFLGLSPGANKEEILDAMKNHVIGFGYLIGTYQR